MLLASPPPVEIENWLSSLVDPSRDATDIHPLSVGRCDTPLGPMWIVADEGGLIALDFVDRTNFGPLLQTRVRLLTAGRPVAITPSPHPWIEAARTQLGQYFAGQRKDFDLPLRSIGSEFDTRAWRYLSTIPHGQTRTYGQQALALGCPTAARAVGAANGRNLLAIVIPCHRVVGANGKLTGFASGTERKAWLLEHERITHQSQVHPSGPIYLHDRSSA